MRRTVSTPCWTSPSGLRVVPAVTERGICQHINSAVDVSSYPLAEAREYVRNLARLRFNHITFHSYPGQWYEYRHAKARPLSGVLLRGAPRCAEPYGRFRGPAQPARLLHSRNRGDPAYGGGLVARGPQVTEQVADRS